MAIKKAFQPIMTLLAANMEATVADIYEEVEALTKAKVGGGGSAGTTFHRNSDGVVCAIKDYYFGVWVSPEVVEFGAKNSTATGLNTMSKQGQSLWNKRENAYKKAKNEAVDSLMSGDIDEAQMKALITEAEEARSAVETLTLDDGSVYGFDSLEDCLADNETRGLAH